MSLHHQDFQRLSCFINDELGIKMPPSKATMLEGRLAKRLRALKLDSYGAYCDYLFSDQGLTEEMVHLTNAVTTNKTDFSASRPISLTLPRPSFPSCSRSAPPNGAS